MFCVFLELGSDRTRFIVGTKFLLDPNLINLYPTPLIFCYYRMPEVFFCSNCQVNCTPDPQSINQSAINLSTNLPNISGMFYMVKIIPSEIKFLNLGFIAKNLRRKITCANLKYTV